MSIPMNRDQRRKMNLSKESSEKLNKLNSPCTIMEVVQLAQGVFEDGISNYHKSIQPLIVSLSLQLELIKDMLFENNVLNKDDYDKLLEDRIKDYNEQKEAAMRKLKETQEGVDKPSSDVNADIVAHPIEVDVTKK